MNLRLTSAAAILTLSASFAPAQPSVTPLTSQAQPAVPASAPTPALAPPVTPPKPEGVHALGGEWIYVEDRTEGQPLERLGPPMASKFTMRVEDDGKAVILNGHGSGHRDVRVVLDGAATEVTEANKTVVRYSGSWKSGVFQYEVKFDKEPGQTGLGMIRRTFQPTAEGLIVRVAIDPPADSAGTESVGLYRHAEDIPLPTPAKAAIADVAWLSGAWVGKRSTGSSIEERWSPPLGGAMLAVSRTVNTSGKMVAFEFLRIIEREGGLVYSAQPGGATKTDFILTEFGPADGGRKRAVFENPRHDYPKRIVYELSADGGLSATIGFLKGGTPRRFDFTREEQAAAKP